MDQIALGILHHSVPYMREQVHTKDMHIYHWGGKAFGYPQNDEKYKLQLVHSSTLLRSWDVSYPGQTPVVMEVSALPLRKVSGTFLSGMSLKKLAPLGELAFTTNGKCAEFLSHFTGSSEYLQALSTPEVFNSTYFARTRNVEYLYGHLYAQAVMLRTRGAGVSGVGASIQLLDLLKEVLPEVYEETAALIADHTNLNFEAFAPRAIAILNSANVKIMHRYDD